MTTENLWEQFLKSGCIADYLQYAAQKGSNRIADSERCGTGAETTGRTGQVH